MVIDDDVPLCRMLAETLYLEGYAVATMIIPLARAGLMSTLVVRALRQAQHPTIILADPTTFGIPGTEGLTTYLQDESQRRPHLLYLMTALIAADAARAMSWLHADSRIAMPISVQALLALIENGERILRDRTSTVPDPFTIDY